MRNNSFIFNVRRFLQKLEGSAAWRLPVFHENKRQTCCIRYSTTKRNKTENEPISIEQNVLLRCPNGTVIIIVSWKAGSAPRTRLAGKRSWFWMNFWSKRWSKGWLFGNQTFKTNRDWNPLKLTLGAVLKKHENRLNNYRGINGFWWSKTIEQYWKKQTLFLILGYSRKQW